IVSLRSDTVRMPDGEVIERQVVEHPGAVAVVAIDEAGQVLMIRQYRHPVGRLLWEIPAGLRDVAGEPLLAAAERELLEETADRARDWLVHSRRQLRRRWRGHPGRRRRGVAGRRSDPEGEGAGCGGVRPDAQGPGS